MGKRAGDTGDILPDIFMRPFGCIRYRRHLPGRRVRKPLEEDDRKAVFGKTECTV